MKISDIKTFPTWVGNRNQLVIKVETDDGYYGWGESGLSGRELAVAGAVSHYREFLLGRDPRQIGALWQEMYRSQYFEGGRVLTAAISAIDITLHDIMGKVLDVPVYQLLGGKQRDKIPCFATTGGGSFEEVLTNCRKLLELGWDVLRVGGTSRRSHDKPNTYEPRDTIGATAERFIGLRKELGPDPVLGIDYHHQLSVAETASFCQRLPSGTLDFIEEPIRDESPEAYESLRTMVDVPFAIGEEFASKWQFQPYLERGITQFARLDVCNVVKVASFAYWEAIDREAIGKINQGRHYPGHADEFETSMSLHICPQDTRMDRMHEIEDKYGLHGPGPDVPPGHQFLATTTYEQTGLRQRLLCDVATDDYHLASAEKGAQFAELSVAGTAAYLADFIDNVAV